MHHLKMMTEQKANVAVACNIIDIACVASVSVQFGSKELQSDEWSE